MTDRTRRTPFSFVSIVALATATTTACSRAPAGENAVAGPAGTTGTTSAEAPRDRDRDRERARDQGADVVDLFAHFDDCTLGHRGTLLDLGDPTSRAVYGPVLAKPNVEPIERDGATWARVRSHALTLDFVAGDPPPEGAPAGTVVMARVRGGTARSVSVSLDGRAIGTWPLVKNETRIVAVQDAGTTFLPGAHELRLRFNGSLRGADAVAEIDWIRVGPSDGDAPYAAPTRSDALVSAQVGGVAKRAISMRAPGFVRCAGAFPRGAHLDLSLAVAGATSAAAAFGGGVAGAEADVQVRWMRDRAAPLVLGTYRVTAGDAWKAISVPLDAAVDASIDGGGLGAIEIDALHATKGARVLAGEPRIVGRAHAATTTPTAETPHARGVVLVVMGSLSPRVIAPYGGARPMPELSSLAAAGATFDHHRATTTLAAGAVASMLTGLPAYAHAVDVPDVRLPAALTTIADAARQSGALAAMFTANPTTGAAFGFDHGWSTFDAVSPADDVPSTRPFDAAAQWIGEHKDDRFVVVVHARGGHPPWEITADELKKLPPDAYTGGVDPKHAAELLARARRPNAPLHVSDADRTRAWALYEHALDAHDAALGRLVAAIRAAGRDGDTAIVVTGDASVDDAAHVPFVDVDARDDASARGRDTYMQSTHVLDEGPLWVPLVLRPPTGAAFARGRHVDTATAGVDVARTVLSSLGLAAPATFGGVDLWPLAQGDAEATPRALVATLGPRTSLRWGSFVLAASGDRETRFCDLSLEPACVTDVRATHPLAASLLHTALFDRFVAEHPRGRRESATLDARTQTALKVWGR